MSIARVSSRFFVVLASVSLFASGAGRLAAADDFVYDGKQAEKTFTLKDVESHTVYQQEEQDETCYRTVQDGTKPECHTAYDQQCHTEEKHECHGVDHQVCGIVERPQCSTEYQNECHTENHQECTTVEHNECHTENECHTVSHQECHEDHGHQDCHEVSQQECSPVQKCQEVPQQQCHEVSQQVCQQVPHQSCHDVPQTECHNEVQQVCADVPEQVCVQVPKNVCVQVPNMVQQAYTCQKEVEVPVGTQVDFNVTDSVTVDFPPILPSGFIPNETFTVSLDQETTTLALKSDSKQFLIASTQTTQVQILPAPQEKQVTSHFAVSLLPIRDFLSPIAGGIQGVAVSDANVLTFSVGAVLHPELFSLELELTGTAADGSTDPVSYFSGPLPTNSYALTHASDRTDVQVDLNQLKLTRAFPEGDYTLKITAVAQASSIANLMNAASITAPMSVSSQATVHLTHPLTAADLPTILAPIESNPTSASLTGTVLSYSIAQGVYPQFLTYQLHVVSNENAVLFDGMVPAKDIQLTNTPDGLTSVQIDVSRLTLSTPLVDGTLTVKFTVGVDKAQVLAQLGAGTALPSVLEISGTGNFNVQVSLTAAQVLAPVQGAIDSIALDSQKNTLTFEIPLVIHPSTLMYHLKISRSGFLGIPKTVFEGELNEPGLDPSEPTLQSLAGGKSRGTFDLSNLSLSEALKAQQYSVDLTVQVNPGAFDGNLDPSLIPAGSQVRAQVKVQAN